MTTKLSHDEILKRIHQGQPFEAVFEDQGARIKVESYVPYLCAAIHDGHNLRESMKSLCVLDDNQRYHEEDPYTGDMIKDCPMTLIALDSRFEYDLNRAPEICIHQDAWGKQVWSTPLSDEEHKKSQQKHERFYQVLQALIDKSVAQFGFSLVYDVHSYNILDREYSNPPMFNIGTHFIDMSRYGKVVEDWMQKLQTLELPNIVNEVKENEVYFGKGYLAQKMMGDNPNCLVLPTEVKKIYADENKPIPFVPVIEAIASGFKRTMPLTVKKMEDLA